jgi:PAS domain-containing protein
MLDWLFGTHFSQELQRIADSASRGDSYSPPSRGSTRQRAVLGSLSSALNALRSSLRSTEEQVGQLEHSLSAANAELAQARQQAEDARARHELLASAVEGGLWEALSGESRTLDMKAVVWWSDGLRRMLGFENETDFPNRLDSWASRLHPDDRKAALDTLTHQWCDQREGSWPDARYRLAGKDGGYRWILSRVSTAREPGRKSLRIAGSMTDITQHRENEATLDVALTRFTLASEMLNDGIWDLDVVAGDPVNPSNVFWWSDQFRHLVGFENEQDFRTCSTAGRHACIRTKSRRFSRHSSIT